MKKSIITIVAFLAVALVATSAFSWSPGRGCQKFGQGDCPVQGGGYGANAWNDLSQEQKDGLSALRQKFIDETYETRAAMMTKHQEMRMLMETSSPDRTKLDALVQEMTDLRQLMFGKGIDFQLEAKKIAPEAKLFGMGEWDKGGKGGGRCGKGDRGGKGGGNCGGCPNQSKVSEQ